MTRRSAAPDDVPATLPDLLAPGLDIVFVGINPGLFSARQGHYFARRTNRFWPGFSRSHLSEEARRGLGVATLAPEHDRALLRFGFGFTDVVKRPTGNAAELAGSEFASGAPALLAKLERYRPLIACFHGLTGWRPFHLAVFGGKPGTIPLGIQPQSLGRTRCFVAPNPSPANAHFTLADQVVWYDALAEFRDSLRD